MGLLWLEIVAGVVGVLVLAVVVGLMVLSMLPSPTTRELYKKVERWRRSRVKR